ncbi:pedal peptide 4 [Elysia marginata]|uniref:Pedal peptide 4 n=1 Tax=Elysia marginata TaxID=1093978 RepID=A0AAV4H5U8_9GAST|nr:pedal peptide 4 [Elysia marginata]
MIQQKDNFFSLEPFSATGLDSSVGSGLAPWPRGRGFETQPSTVRAPTGWVGDSKATTQELSESSRNIPQSGVKPIVIGNSYSSSVHTSDGGRLLDVDKGNGRDTHPHASALHDAGSDIALSSGESGNAKPSSSSSGSRSNHNNNEETDLVVQREGWGRLPGGQSRYSSGENSKWRPVHHVSRRSFDSINTGDLRGMYQNYVGDEYPPQNWQYRSGDARRRSYFSGGKRSVSEDFPQDDPESLPWEEGDSSDSDQSTKWLDDAYREYQSKHSSSDDFEPQSKRGFDSISRWRSGVSGISQNFIGPKRGDYNSFRSSLGRHVGQILDFNKRENSQNQIYPRASFDSISYGPTYGLSQNYLNKRDNKNNLLRWLPGGFRESFILKRSLQRLGELLDDNSKNIYSSEPPEKRQFDSINTGQISGMNQNHIGKRQFDSISTGGSFGTFGQNFINKRYFDSINSGSRLSNMYQNYISKRDLELNPSAFKRFDSISSGKLHGMGQNFISKRTSDSPYSTEIQDQVPSEVLGMPVQHFISRRSIPSGGQINSKLNSKRQFDSINSGFAGMGQNFVSKKASSYTAGSDDGLRNLERKRYFDSIGRTRLGGMSQNFISKRILDSIGSGRIGGLNQNFIAKRHFDSINGGKIGGMSQNFIGRKRFDSISNNKLFGMGQNFISKRYFDSISNNELGGMRQNFISKRGFDSINNGPIGGFRQNFVSKKNFDTIGNNRLYGMNQNFISKRLRFLAGKDRGQQSEDSFLGLPNFETKTGDDEQEDDFPHGTPGSDTAMDSEGPGGDGSTSVLSRDETTDTEHGATAEQDRIPGETEQEEMGPSYASTSELNTDR